MFELFKKKKDIFIGLCKCPTHKKLYGVRIEEEGNKWTATWAFKITEQVAKREKYEANVFPPDIKYHKEYPGCPYCNKHEDLATITKPEEKPMPKKNYRISVTKRGCDDIGSILTSLKIPFKAFSEIGYDCDLLFLNCLTSDSIDSNKLREFVNKGGCLYASDLTERYVKVAFPGYLDFVGNTGKVCNVDAEIVDKELREIVGDKMKIVFNLPAWAVLRSCKGETLLKAAPLGLYGGLPLMVKFNYGKGMVFFTCFHNYVQASDKEKAFLQLLVLRQLGMNGNTSIENAGKSIGVDIDAIKKKFKRNF